MRSIKVLGPGCAKCKKLAMNVEEAVANLGGDFDYEYVTDINRIIGYGIMMTPALVLDEIVVSAGRVLNVKDIEELLKK